MAQQQYCCDCEELNRNDTYKPWFSDETKYKCKVCYEYKSLTDPACRFIKPLKKDTGSYTPSGCFITTIVCNILGYEDNCELLTLLRDFRDNTLKTNPEYIPILLQYDKIGPLISEGIQKEPNHDRLCLGLMTYFLIPCANAIKEGNISEAVEIYQNMVVQLSGDFEIPITSISASEDYDLETIGKGRIRTPQTSGC